MVYSMEYNKTYNIYMLFAHGDGIKMDVRYFNGYKPEDDEIKEVKENFENYLLHIAKQAIDGKELIDEFVMEMELQ
jgi:hypothetical protein